MNDKLNQLLIDGQFEEARQICKGFKTQESYLTVARTYVSEKEFTKAEEYYKKALKLNPKYPEALNELGVIYINHFSRYNDAEKCFQKIIKQKPDSFAYNNLGICCVNQGKHNDAAKYFLKSFELDPNFAPIENICKAYVQTSQADLAENIVNQVEDRITDHNGLAELYVGLAYQYEMQENYTKAEELNLKALKYNDQSYMAYNNMGSINLKNNRLDEGEKYYLKALEIKSDYTLAICNMGNIAKYRGDTDKAFDYYLQAYNLGDESETVFSNIGVILTERGQIREGIEYYEKALAKNPNHRDILFNYSLSLLMLGDFDNGFKYYEVRKTKSEYLRIPGNEWKGEKNRIVVVLPEQGFGDVLQFCRYIPMIKAISKKVIFVCPKALIPLMENLEGVDEIIEMNNGAKLPPYENFVFMMSLPHIFKTTVDTIPSEYQYIYADEEKTKYWAARMAQYEGLKVGICWTGNPRRFSLQLTTVDSRRSMKLSQFESILGVENVTFFSLQKDDDLNQIVDYPQIVDFMPEVRDFADTAAIIQNLDLIISVDTSIVHLAGALNKKVWMLSRYDNCWRWLMNRIDSPWYPSMWILKQPTPGEWEPVVDTVMFHLNWLANY